MTGPYISRVKISNFRNFKDIDVSLNYKQIIIGENNVGKTNFIKALQLILDPTLSDQERYLDESDFSDSLTDPMNNGETIEIVIEIKGFEKSRNILAQLSDASVSGATPTLRITYRYAPINDEAEKKEYDFIIFKGINESIHFTYEDRKYLNLRVIKALRDVESELKNIKKSPINNLLKNYEIDKRELEIIAQNIKEKSLDVLNLEELKDLEGNINERFSRLAGVQQNSDVKIKTIDIDAVRLLNTLTLLMGSRPVSETSLGLANILYISLLLLLVRDKTVPTFFKKDVFDQLKKKDTTSLLHDAYEVSEKENYFLKKGLGAEVQIALHDFMDAIAPRNEGTTILAIEEPEAHLHPTLQRLMYKDIIRKGDSSVLFTTHSTHIASVSPIEYIVHLYRPYVGSTIIKSSADVELSVEDKIDIERYVDATRGEIYFGKGVILVEGISEEYLVPRFAELLEKPLDEKGIIICNINSTYFVPYVKFLRELGIPYVVITDGDFYVKDGDTRKFHILDDEESDDSTGFLGHEVVKKLLIETGTIKIEDVPEGLGEQEELFNDLGFFIGYYTLEIDIMNDASEQDGTIDIISRVFNDIATGGKKQKENFKNELQAGDYWSCLRKIESSSSKGRFAQRLASMCNSDLIPIYIKKAIEYMYQKVEDTNE